MLWTLALVAAPSFAHPSPGDEGANRVRTDRRFFNPSIGQSIQIFVDAPTSGTLSLEVLDRDGYVVRKLGDVAVEAGEFVATWDGRDDQGEVVPDEAYSFRMSLSAKESLLWSYDPARAFEAHPTSIDKGSYSRVGGVLSYDLERASRVHIQAGQVTGRSEEGASGPVLKTLAANVPRVAGKVIETWSGFDESGKFYVPDLNGFAFSILATPLPENSLITVGNRKVRFAEYALRNRPAERTQPRDLRASAARHHHGLTSLEDTAPSVAVLPCAIDKGASEKSQAAGKGRCFEVRLDPQWAPYFLSQPTVLYVFLDELELHALPNPTNPARVELDEAALARGGGRLVVNWTSRLGPSTVGVTALPSESHDR